LLVVGVVAGVWFGYHTITAQAKEIGRLASDLSDTEDELLVWVKDKETADRVTGQLQRDLTLSREQLGKRLKMIKEMEGRLDEAFRSCLDITVPAEYRDGLHPSESEDRQGATPGHPDGGLLPTGAAGNPDPALPLLGSGAGPVAG